MPSRPPQPPEIAAARPERKPSVWRPQPTPTPGPGRSTEDPKTPTLKALAVRAAQQASATADATRVARPPVAPRGDATELPAVGPVPTRLARGLRTLDPAADQARYEALEAARQQGTVADKLRRRAERAALVARGRAAGARALDPSQGAVTRAADRLEQFSRDIELARLSRDVYRLPGEPGAAPVGWTRLSDDPSRLPPALRNPKLWRNDRTGFVAGLYREADELGGRTVLAFRGTADGAGWKTDAQQAIGGSTDQYSRAAQLTTLAQAAYGDALMTTGHSLGGGLATQASAITGARGATFNPAGLHAESLRGTGKTPESAAHLLTSYHVRGEVLSSVQGELGRAVLAPMVSVAPGGAAAFGGLGRPTEAGDFAPGTIPGPTGRRFDYRPCAPPKSRCSREPRGIRRSSRFRAWSSRRKSTAPPSSATPGRWTVPTSTVRPRRASRLAHASPRWRRRALLRLLSLGFLLIPLACRSQGGTRVLGHDLTEFYDANAPAARLAAAAARGDSAEVAALVRAGADPNAPGRDGMLPLTWAYMAESEPGVRALLAADADPNRRAGTSGTEGDVAPITFAAGARDPKWLVLYLSHGGSPNAPGMDDEPLIFDAIRTRQLDRVRLLVERGADVNARGLGDNTALVAAASLNQFPIVRYLLEHGADWQAPGGAGLTVAYLVQSRTVDPEFRNLLEAQRWTRAFLEARGVRFPVPGPAEQRTSQHFGRAAIGRSAE